MRMQKDITPAEVVQMFSARAGGAKVNDIAKQFDCAQACVSRTLRRQIFAHVPVPPKIAEKVASMCGPSTKRTKKRAIVKATGTADAMDIAEYVAACRNLNIARERCLKAGYSEDMLDLLSEA